MCSLVYRNCHFLSKRSFNAILRANPTPEVPTVRCSRRLLHGHMCSKVTPLQQGAQARFLRNKTGVFSSVGSISWRGHATESAERKERPQVEQAQPDEDVAWPNEAWSDVAKEIFHQLNAGTEGGGWKRYPGFLRTGDRRLFSRNVTEKGKGFEYAMFVNKKEQRATAVCQFGPYLEGPPGHAHGGAVATMLDNVMGFCAIDVMEGFVMTANLNINYKSPIRLGSTALFHAKVDKMDGRKGYLSAYVTSADGRTTLCEATALFIKLSPEQIERGKKYFPEDSRAYVKGR